jgi:hypothetical protein
MTTASVTAAKERPIIFSGESVSRIQEGRKWQTRRVVKQPLFEPLMERAMAPGCGIWRHADGVSEVRCPYGRPGDRLWVKETWDCTREEATMMFDNTNRVASGEKFYMIMRSYRADFKGEGAPETGCWRSPLFMPRWASRLLLEITDVRVERLQEISEEDAAAEGMMPQTEDLNGISCTWTRRSAFIEHWNALNAKRGYGWDVNHWVWVVSFKVIEG